MYGAKYLKMKAGIGGEEIILYQSMQRSKYHQRKKSES
jgi:hypothetical protein